MRPTTELDVVRRLTRDVDGEQDEHGILTRVDEGSAGSPLRLRLGERRWDGGAMPLEAQDWDSHRLTIAHREPFAELAWVWVDPAGRVRVAIDSGMPRFDATGRFVGYAGLSRDAGAETVGGDDALPEVVDGVRRGAVLPVVVGRGGTCNEEGPVQLITCP